MHRDKKFLLTGLSPEKYAWRGVLWVAIFYVGALCFGAIVGPALYNFNQAWYLTSPNELNTYLAEKDLEQFFDRARWAFAILVLPMLFKVVGFYPKKEIQRLRTSWGGSRQLLCTLQLGFRRLGLRFNHIGWAQYGKHFAFGAALAGLIVAGQLLFTNTNLKPDLSMGSVAGALVAALLGGVLLGFLEEFLFRGVIFRCFYAALPPLLGIAATSAFFAYTHFRHPDELFADANSAASVRAGWEIAFWTLFGILKSFAWLPFCNLFMFGTLLNLTLLRSRTLMAPAGLHAGAVFVMLSYSKNFNIHGGLFSRELWGGGGIVDGIVPLVILTGLVVWMGWRVTKPKVTK